MSCAKRKRVYVDMDDVLCDYRTSYLGYMKSHPLIHYPQSIPGFFENLQPIPGAIDAVNVLRSSEQFDVYVLTAPSTKNPLSYTEKRLWIEKYFGYEFTEKLIICSNKGLLLGEYLIDDNLHGKGQEHFKGEVLHYGSEQFPDWGSVLARLFADFAQ